MKKNFNLKILIICACLVLSLLFCAGNEPVFVRANLNINSEPTNINQSVDLNTQNITYDIYDENGNLIDTKQGVEAGDYFVLNNLKAYEIKSVDGLKNTAVAEYLGEYDAPQVSFSDNVKLISGKNQNKTIGIYMSHNDESYTIGDGVDSVYGEGGIHDISNLLAQNLSELGITAVVDETLHLPHDTLAYNRSKSTAQGLLNDNSYSIFDIHRDGAPRSAFITEHNGEEYCQVRIVIGQNNENQEENLALATNMLSIGNEMYPFLFKDIYFGKGGYNQSLSKNALLFEMGSHMVEKDLVEKSVPLLADVINKTLFESETNNNGDLVVYKNKAGNTNKPKLLSNQMQIQKGKNTASQEIY